MLKNSSLVLILSMVMGLQGALGAACLESAMPSGESSLNVKLLTQIPKPYFYFRASDDHFAILVSSTSVRRALESASTRNEDARELLALIVKDLPLARSTDLFKYVLSDPYQLTAIQNVLVSLLASGDAAVFDAETGRLSKTIEIRMDNSDRMRSRTFHGPNGAILLRSVDCIED